MADVRAIISEPSTDIIVIADLTTATVLATVSEFHPSAIAVLPNATEAYVLNSAGIPGNVYPVALPAYTAGTTLVVGNQPYDVSASPDGTHVYTVNDISPTGTVTPIATPANTVQPDITLTGTTGPRGIAVNPSSTTVYVTASGGVNSGIIPIAIPSNVVGASFGASLAANNPLGIAITPDGLHAYVASFTAGGIYPVDLVAMTVGSLITLTGSSFISNCYVTPDGTQVFIPDGGTNTVYVVSTATNLQTHAISLSPLTGVPNSGGFDATGTFFYTTVNANGAIASVNTSTYAVATAMSGLAGPSFLKIIPVPGPPPTPPYPGGTFIPKLFIPQKGKINTDYTVGELTANWIAIELWSQRWEPPAPVALFFPDKHSTDPNLINANWIVMENWVNQINQAEKAPYPTLFIPRKSSDRPTDLDVDFLRVQNWANGLS